jgi:hypothetical protein
MLLSREAENIESKLLLCSVPLEKCAVDQKVSLQKLYVYFASFIRRSNNKSSNLIGLRSHSFSTTYMPLMRHHIVREAFFLPVDLSPCPTSSAILSHVCPPHDHPYSCEDKMIL